MTKTWNSSIWCVNNLPTNMKRLTHYAASVTWLTAKTHFYAEPLCGCAEFTYKRWCHRKCQGRGWYVCLSVCRHAAQVTEDCQLGAMFIMVEPNFFILTDTGKKLLSAFLSSYEESGTTFGLFSSVGHDFFNLSNYLLYYMSFCFSMHTM